MAGEFQTAVEARERWRRALLAGAQGAEEEELWEVYAAAREEAKEKDPQDWE